MRSFHVAAALLVLSVPVPALAQLGGLDELFKRVTDISVFASRGLLHPAPQTLTTGQPGERKKSGLVGYGLELSFAIGEVTTVTHAGKVDTSRSLVEMTVTRKGGVADTTFKMTTKVDTTPALTKTLASFELGLGYSQLAGFRARDTTYDFRGALREFPSVAVYATFFPDAPISPYLGVKSGLVQLHNARLYDSSATGPVFPVDAQTIQAGIVAGLVAELGPVNFFLEPSYAYRRFASLDVKGEDALVPRRFPRELDFSGYVFSVGVLVGLGKQEERK